MRAGGTDRIRLAVPCDLEAVVSLAGQLWPGHAPGELQEELEPLLSSDEAAFALVFDDNGRPAGFAQCQLRHDYVEGSAGSPTAYLEGILVREDCRRRGLARELQRACEDWARGHGCTEMGSDCSLDNAASERYHLHAGFQEANRIICFIKEL